MSIESHHTLVKTFNNAVSEGEDVEELILDLRRPLQKQRKPKEQPVKSKTNHIAVCLEKIINHLYNGNNIGSS